MGSLRDRRRSVVASAAILVALLTGCAGPAADVSSAQPLPSASASATRSAAAPPAEVPAVGLEVLPASTPVSLSIPSTDTSTELISLGLQNDRTLEVPPEDPGAPAGWYNLSPTPGERGPAVLLGHVNATGGGPGVFAKLRELKVGDTIEVTREDGSTATFEFQRGEQYEKDTFPTQEVYGNTEGAELRMITCDGFDLETGLFDDNYVVYASLRTT
ncbi:class F sortase [Arthrobacter ruber]|uniref:class F sortase n=1 Tax=Arthrobacter ruber TaxID=1258893 RepID=UPI0023E8E138|nr:class F sortase [Arthrobacter ruber]